VHVENLSRGVIPDGLQICTRVVTSSKPESKARKTKAPLRGFYFLSINEE
jgi:hypothetical protein